MRVFKVLRRVFQLFSTPIVNQTLSQRLVRALLFWGMTGVLWDIFSFGAVQPPIDWIAILALLVIPLALGSVVFAILEHAFYRAYRRNS
jgi:hypothetical protein